MQSIEDPGTYEDPLGVIGPHNQPPLKTPNITLLLFSSNPANIPTQRITQGSQKECHYILHFSQTFFKELTRKSVFVEETKREDKMKVLDQIWPE